jgi:hypothetical protein
VPANPSEVMSTRVPPDNGPAVGLIDGLWRDESTRNVILLADAITPLDDSTVSSTSPAGDNGVVNNSRPAATEAGTETEPNDTVQVIAAMMLEALRPTTVPPDVGPRLGVREMITIGGKSCKMEPLLKSTQLLLTSSN